MPLGPTLRWPRISLAPHANLSGGREKLSALGRLAFGSLWLLVFAIPWEDAITIPGLGTSARLIGMVTVGLGVLAITERAKIRRPAPGHLLMLLFVLSAAASYLWSLYPEGTIIQIFTYLQLFTMAWLIWELACHAREQKLLMQAYVFGTFVSGFDTVYRFISHQESGYQRYAGAGLNANDLGLIMALSIPVSYYLLIQSHGKIAWVYRLQLIVAATTVLLTASRGAALATVVALMIVPVTQARLSRRQKIAVILTVLLLGCGTLMFVPATSWERISQSASEVSNGTLTGRTIIWQAGWDLFRAYPVFGIGANAFRVMVSRELAEAIHPNDYGSPAPPAHNTFLSVLVEQGLIGLLAFGSLLVSLMLSLKSAPPLAQKFWGVCLAVWVVGVSTLTWEMRKPTWFFFGLLLVQCGSMIHKSRGAYLRAALVDRPGRQLVLRPISTDAFAPTENSTPIL